MVFLTSFISRFALSLFALFLILIAVGISIIVWGWLDKNCPGCDMVMHQGQRANFQGLNLEGVQMWQADLTGANLTSANLSNGNLSGTSFQHANLTNADLS